MTEFPLTYILLYLSALLSPSGTETICVQGPEREYIFSQSGVSWETKKSVGQYVQTNVGDVWRIKGPIVTRTRGDKVELRKVATYVEGISEHDWDQSKFIAISPNYIVEKTRDGFTYAYNSGSSSEVKFQISYERKLPRRGR